MTTTDPTTILREAIKAVVIESEADDVLATRIPQACQTCKGDAKVTEPMGPMLRGMKVIDCPDCPTILTLLLYGWNGRTIIEALTELVIWMSGSPTFGPGGEGHDEWVRAREAVLKPALAALREVPT